MTITIAIINVIIFTVAYITPVTEVVLVDFTLLEAQLLLIKRFVSAAVIIIRTTNGIFCIEIITVTVTATGLFLYSIVPFTHMVVINTATQVIAVRVTTIVFVATP